MAVCTWNPSDKSAGYSLSGGDLIATHGASNAGLGVRGTLFRSAGLHYFEITLGQAVQWGDNWGAAKAAANLGGYAVDHAGIAGVRYDAQVGASGGTNHLPSWNNAGFPGGTVLGFLFNFNNNTLLVYHNGVVDALGTTTFPAGSYAPYVASYYAGSDTLNVGESAFLSLPSGASPWAGAELRPVRIAKPVVSPRPIHFIGL